MGRIISVLIIIVIFILPSNAQNLSNGEIQDSTQKEFENKLLSDKSQISLLTFEPGNDTYSVWGHTAIRIKDKLKGVDLVYNYGTFNFDEPNFLLKFLRGKLDYSISFDKYKDVIRYYKYYKRGVHEQILDLSYKEKTDLYKLLIKNYKKENRYYKYDFFFDNCSTRPLNIIEKSIQGKLILKKSGNDKTFRQLIDWQISNHEWMDFGIDLIIGAKADKFPTPRQSSFLPFQLKEYFNSAIVNIRPSVNDVKSNKTTIKKLVKKDSVILDISSKSKNTPLLFLPIWVFTFFFLIEIILFYFSYKKGKILYSWYDKAWFVIAFIGGMLITFLWFFTDHQATKENWNYNWLNPLYFFVFLKKGNLKDLLIFSVTILLFITLAGFSFFPQQLHPAIIPILGLLILKIIKYGVLRRFFGLILIEVEYDEAAGETLNESIAYEKKIEVD